MVSKGFFVGIDFGSYKTSIVASNGRRDTLQTAVGWAKDDVARAFLGVDVVLGDQLPEVELAVDIVRPFRRGALKFLSGTEAGVDASAHGKSLDAARLVLERALSSVQPPEGEAVFAAIGAPSRATVANKSLIIEAASGIFAGVVIVAEPFTIAYGAKRLMNTVVVDIGAGTTDICPLQGTYPTEEDQATIPVGGDAIDDRFLQAIQTEFPDAQVTIDIAREIKEKYGFVHDSNEPAIVTLRVAGVPRQFDVTDILRESCRAIVPPIVEELKNVIARVHPRFQQSMLSNVLLGGGGSQLKGLDALLEQGLSPLGPAQVTRVKDTVYAGAAGALRLAMSMPIEKWEQFAAGQTRNSAAA